MNVNLISITQDVTNNLTPEELIVYIARVSNPSNQNNKESSPKLINYLIKNKHWSPFEMVDMTLEIVTTRAVAQQIIRHRSFNFSERSMRYTSDGIGIEPIELRQQAKSNRQSSSNVIENKEIRDLISKLNNDSLNLYNKMIDSGIAREVSRGVLPLNTETVMYMKGSIRSWLSYLNVRLEENTQKEHRLIAQKISEIIKDNFPHISQATNDFNNFNGNFM